MNTLQFFLGAKNINLVVLTWIYYKEGQKCTTARWKIPLHFVTLDKCSCKSTIEFKTYKLEENAMNCISRLNLNFHSNQYLQYMTLEETHTLSHGKILEQGRTILYRATSRDIRFRDAHVAQSFYRQDFSIKKGRLWWAMFGYVVFNAIPLQLKHTIIYYCCDNMMKECIPNDIKLLRAPNMYRPYSENLPVGITIILCIVEEHQQWTAAALNSCNR
jgi:hypothetical protein